MIVVCIICIDFVCMLNIKSIRLITLWSEVSYRDVSHQRHPLLSTCFHMFQNKLDEREREEGIQGVFGLFLKNVALFSKTVRVASISQECLYCRWCVCWLTVV